MNEIKPLTIKTSQGKILPVWGVDFETFYEDSRSGYSLRNPNLSTTEYIHHELFKAHGASVKDPYGKLYWVTHEDLPAFFQELSSKEVAFAAHNCAFDGYIAKYHYGYVPQYYIDTMGMSAGIWGPHLPHSLDMLCKRLKLEGKIKGTLESIAGVRDLSSEQEEALATYANQDIEQTVQAFEKMYFDHGYPTFELDLIDLTIRMYADPKIRVNPSLLNEEIEEEDIRLTNLLSSVTIPEGVLSSSCKKKLESEGVSAVLRSRPCFVELLRSRGVEPPLKQRVSKEGDILDETTYALAKSDLELQQLAKDPRVSDLVDCWTGLKSSIKKSRAESLLKQTKDGTLALPIPLKYIGAHTHRWSGWGGINLQNFPSGRDGTVPRLRHALIAPEGYRIVVSDLSQIEARLNAWLWGQDDLLHEFAIDGDPYSTFISELYKIPVVKGGINKHLRPLGKAGILGLGFGMSALKFKDTCEAGTLTGEPFPITLEEAQEVVDFYRAKNFRIVDGWGQLQNALNLMAAKQCNLRIGPMRFLNEQVVMPNNLSIHYRDIHYQHDKKSNRYNLVYRTRTDPKTGEVTWIRIWGSASCENFVQSLARTVVAEHALKISYRYPVLSLVHDEVLALAPENEADEALEYMQGIMKVPPIWCPDLPLASEGGHDVCYSK